MIEQARYVVQVPMRVSTVTLEGRRVRLVPMTRDYAKALLQAADFPEVWEYTSTPPMRSIADVTGYVDEALAEQAAGDALPFVTIDPATGDVIGSTRFANINPANRRLAIGWTWLRPDHQHAGVNGEAKALMLRHAFEGWGALRVEIRTDVRNFRSRAAIERIGGTYEGTFRQHMILRDGRVRDTAFYSIADRDWCNPSHRAYLNAMEHGITPRSDPIA